MSKKAHYAAGLNDFTYSASLCIHHPNIHPDQITNELGLAPTVTHCPGEQRTTPKGTPLNGVWESSYWTAELDVIDGEDVSAFLSRLIDRLTPATDFLNQISKEGAQIECFLGLFATALCDQCIPAKRLSRLGQLNVDLRLDYYGGIGTTTKET